MNENDRTTLPPELYQRGVQLCQTGTAGRHEQPFSKKVKKPLIFSKSSGCMSGIQFNGFTLAIDQIKSLALWSKPNEVSPQTKKSNDL